MRFAVNTSLVFGDLPLERRPQAARDAGGSPQPTAESWRPFDSVTPAGREVEHLPGDGDPFARLPWEDRADG